MLYSTGLAGLNDILVGNNAGCGTPGFNVTEGWDAGSFSSCVVGLCAFELITEYCGFIVTGLGTPDFKKLKEIVLGL